jgi:hypothetical protein
MTKNADDTTALVPLAGTFILQQPPEEMSIPQRTQAHAVLGFLEKRIAERKSAIRDFLLEDAKANGEANEHGSKKMDVAGTSVMAVKGTTKEPTFEKMAELLAAKGLSITAAYDEKVTYAYNPSKVQQLIDTGHLKQKDVEALHPETFSLRVTPGGELKKLLDEAGKAMPARLKEAK